MMWIPVMAIAAVEHAADAAPHPVIPDGGDLAMNVAIIIAALFLAAAIIGPVCCALRHRQPDSPAPDHHDHAAPHH